MCVRTSAHHEPGLKLLAIKYGVALGVTVDSMADIWERAVEDTRGTFLNLGVATHLLGQPLSADRRV